MNTVKTVSEHSRSRTSKMLIVLFEHWNLTTKDQLGLLGVSKNNRSLLQRYRRGGSLTNDRDKLDRVAILLSIHKSLRLLFPHNRDMAYSWMTTPNRAFSGCTPTNLIDEQGMMGLYILQNYLNRQIAS